jgi:hypothetical protein
MICAVRDCLVTGYEPLTNGLELVDPDDRHVVAVARTRAQVIVTRSLTRGEAAIVAARGVFGPQMVRL